jgi:hypothetical protein
MAKLSVKPGTTSLVVYVFIQDSSVTTGAGLTGLAFNTGSLVASYVRPLAARTAITLATQTTTGAYSSGGFVELDSTNMPGVYRLDVPDAAIATGVRSATIMLKGAANMAPCLLELDLSNQADVTSWNGSLLGTGAFPELGIADSGTAQAATSTTVQMRSAATFADNTCGGMVVAAFGSTQGYWQCRAVDSNVGSTDTLTVSPAFTVTPSGTITYILFESPPASTASLPNVNASQIGGQTASAAGAVTFPGTIASPTNITAGTITTVTNLTNAPTAGDLTATMKASVTTAATAATPTAAAVTGAVGSVTGNVGGNVTGSIGSLGATAKTDVSTAVLTTQMTESYAADGTAPTLAQATFLTMQSIGEVAVVSTTLTVKKLDGSTTAATYTLNDGTNPTSRTRTT